MNYAYLAAKYNAKINTLLIGAGQIGKRVRYEEEKDDASTVKISTESRDAIIQSKLDVPFKLICIDNSYKQHQNDCWHNTIFQIMCFSDQTKDSVQKKLANLLAEEIVYFTSGDVRKHRKKYIPHCFIYDENIMAKFNTNLVEYVKNLQIRYCNRLELSESRCHPSIGISKIATTSSDAVHIAREVSDGIAPLCNSFAINFTNLNNDGSTSTVQTDEYCCALIINILSYIFLNDDYMVAYIPCATNEKGIDISDHNMINGQIIGVIVGGSDETIYDNIGHMTGFYTCDGIGKYYDGIFNTTLNFDWRVFFMEYNSLFSISEKIELHIDQSINRPLIKTINGEAVIWYKWSETKLETIELDEDPNTYIVSTIGILCIDDASNTSSSVAEEIMQTQFYGNYVNHSFNVAYFNEYLKSHELNHTIMWLFTYAKYTVPLNGVDEFMGLLYKIMSNYYTENRTYDVYSDIYGRSLVNQIIRTDNKYIFEALFKEEHRYILNLLTSQSFVGINIETFYLAAENKNMSLYLEKLITIKFSDWNFNLSMKNADDNTLMEVATLHEDDMAKSLITRHMTT